MRQRTCQFQGSDFQRVAELCEIRPNAARHHQQATIVPKQRNGAGQAVNRPSPPAICQHPRYLQAPERLTSDDTRYLIGNRIRRVGHKGAAINETLRSVSAGSLLGEFPGLTPGAKIMRIVDESGHLHLPPRSNFKRPHSVCQ
jgi:hypothetical protein